MTNAMAAGMVAELEVLQRTILNNLLDSTQFVNNKRVKDMETFKQALHPNKEDAASAETKTDKTGNPMLVVQPSRHGREGDPNIAGYIAHAATQHPTPDDNDTRNLVNMVSRVYLGWNRGNRPDSVQMELDQSVLPGTQLLISEQEGRLDVSFASKNAQSRAWLQAKGAPLTDKLAETLSRDVSLAVKERFDAPVLDKFFAKAPSTAAPLKTAFSPAQASSDDKPAVSEAVWSTVFAASQDKL